MMEDADMVRGDCRQKWIKTGIVVAEKYSSSRGAESWH